MSAITSLAGRNALNPNESVRGAKRRLPSNGLCFGRGGVGGLEAFDDALRKEGELDRLQDDEDDDEDEDADETIESVDGSSSSGKLRTEV